MSTVQTLGRVLQEEHKSKGPGAGMSVPRNSQKARHHGHAGPDKDSMVLSGSGCHGRFPSVARHDSICDH